MKRKMVKIIFPVLLLTFSLPFSVAAQNIEDTETPFVSAQDIEEGPTDSEKPNTEQNPSDSDLDGFISGDDSLEEGNDKPLHVIIENGTTGENQDSSVNEPVVDSGEAFGGGYSGVDSSSGSSAEKIYHKPQVLLEDYNLLGQSVKAGSAMELSVTFRNKSRSQNVFGLKISLSTETKGIEFERNSFYVQRLTPGEAITLKQKMTLTEDCEPGTAQIVFALDYEDSRATSATGSESLTFQITQPAHAKLEASEIPSVFYTMDTVEISVKALNLGRDKIYNASVKMEADGLTSKETAFFGTVDSGTAAQGSLRVYVKGKTGNQTQESQEETEESAKSTEKETTPGKIHGKLILTYEDAEGNSYEEAADFDSEIKEAQIQSLKVEEDQEETNSWWYSIFAVAAVLLLSVILFLLAKLHKKSVLLEEARKAASN
ncbi:hypothetical protein ACTQWG_05445 [Blautia sp. HCP3S3_H10_1]|uniref:hypothetical protein n=1 Tax=unclassified Blautia TaxID=2648079 RepID=UPI003F9317CC